MPRKVASPDRTRGARALDPLGCGCPARFTVRRDDADSAHCTISYQQWEHNDACKARSAFGCLYLSEQALQHLRKVVQDNQHRPVFEIIDLYQRPFAEQCLQLKGIPPSETAIANLRQQWLADPATMPRDARIEEKDVRNMKARNFLATTRSLSRMLLYAPLLFSPSCNFCIIVICHSETRTFSRRQVVVFEETWRLHPDDATSVHMWVQANPELVLFYQEQTGAQVSNFCGLLLYSYLRTFLLCTSGFLTCCHPSFFAALYFNIRHA